MEAERIFIVKQYIRDNWVELIRISSDGPVPDKEVRNSIEQIKDLIFQGETIFLTVENLCVIFKKTDGPIRIEVENK